LIFLGELKGPRPLQQNFVKRKEQNSSEIQQRDRKVTEIKEAEAEQRY